MNCSYCNDPLTEEEIETPNIVDDGYHKYPDPETGEKICDECYDDSFRGTCLRCCEVVDSVDLDADVGRLIGLWEDSPGSGEDLSAGYYRVLEMPFYCSSMLGGGWFYTRSLEWVRDLDDDGKTAAHESYSNAGPICKDCEEKILSSLMSVDEKEESVLKGVEQ